jgi:hypothetical protein
MKTNILLHVILASENKLPRYYVEASFKRKRSDGTPQSSAEQQRYPLSPRSIYFVPPTSTPPQHAVMTVCRN